MITTVIAFLSMTIAVVWSAVFLPASLFGIRVNKVSGFQMKKFFKQISHASIWTNDEPEGWICGKWFLGFVHVSAGDRSEVHNLWILSSLKYYKTHVQEIKLNASGHGPDNTDVPNTITYWVRQGPFWNLQYASRALAVSKQKARVQQLSAIEQILTVYNAKTHVVVLLYGKAGGGKSMTGHFLCAELLKTKKGRPLL